MKKYLLKHNSNGTIISVVLKASRIEDGSVKTESENIRPREFMQHEGEGQALETGIIDSGSAVNVSILEVDFNEDGTIIETVTPEGEESVTLNLAVTPEFNFKLENNGISWTGSELK